MKKFNIFHHEKETRPTPTKEAASLQDESAQLKDGATTVVTMANKSADSDVIIAKVDAAYKEFTSFQTNLKQLLKLYKEEHLALKNMNEKRFEVSVCVLVILCI